ncbi:cupin domain-containing protein [Brevibacillus migulae]|uniref:cupin domain-containing protein n=1 Tax=Brevibacillus migulae TaxID=1644114 RepID=UPI00106E758C|nr:cupin domain-containing protein [Brevibacillus migulae]
MKIFRFDAQSGKVIHQYDSINVVMSRIVRTAEGAHIGCMHIAAGGVVGYHQAGMPQLFLVVQGEGWVTDESRSKVPIKAGQAAYWTAGEWHESGTDTGMMAIIIESDHMDPSRSMTELMQGISGK